MNGNSTITDIRHRLAVMLAEHGVGNDDINQGSINRAAQEIRDALQEAWWMGVEQNDEQ